MNLTRIAQECVMAINLENSTGIKQDIKLIMPDSDAEFRLPFGPNGPRGTVVQHDPCVVSFDPVDLLAFLVVIGNARMSITHADESDSGNDI